MDRLTPDEALEFRQYLRQVTDAQIQHIYDKERYWNHPQEAEMAEAEAERRGIDLDRTSWRSYRPEIRR